MIPSLENAISAMTPLGKSSKIRALIPLLQLLSPVLPEPTRRETDAFLTAALILYQENVQAASRPISQVEIRAFSRPARLD